MDISTLTRDCVIPDDLTGHKLSGPDINKFSMLYITEASHIFNEIFPAIKSFVGKKSNVYIVDVNNLSLSVSFYICVAKLYSKLTTTEQNMVDNVLSKFMFQELVPENLVDFVDMIEGSDKPYNIMDDLKRYRCIHQKISPSDMPNIHKRSKFVVDFFTKYCSAGSNKYILVHGYQLRHNFILHSKNVCLISTDCVTDIGKSCHMVFPFSHSVDDVLILLLYVYIKELKYTKLAIISHDNYRWFNDWCKNYFNLRWSYFDI